jgi:hypothetical protein
MSLRLLLGLLFKAWERMVAILQGFNNEMVMCVKSKAVAARRREGETRRMEAGPEGEGRLGFRF